MMELALQQRQVFSPFPHGVDEFRVRDILRYGIIQFNGIGIVVGVVVRKKRLEECKLLWLVFGQYDGLSVDVCPTDIFGERGVARFRVGIRRSYPLCSGSGSTWRPAR